MEYESMTVAELKDLLRDAGLPVSGKKADLIARLEEAADTPAEAEDTILPKAGMVPLQASFPYWMEETSR